MPARVSLSEAGRQEQAMTSDVSVRSARRVIEGVAAHGVRYIFGIPGAKADEVYDALADGGPELIVCRHEQNAAFMAAAIGRLTGTPGVVLVTSGPGTANLTTGLVTANTEGDPVVALCGAVPLADRLKHTHQSMNAAALLSAVTKYTAEITDPGTVPEAVANAFRVATAEPRGPAALVLADDVMAAPTDARITAAAPAGPLGPAPAGEVGKAAAMIRSAARPVLLVGLRRQRTPPEPAAHSAVPVRRPVARGHERANQAGRGWLAFDAVAAVPVAGVVVGSGQAGEPYRCQDQHQDRPARGRRRAPGRHR
jgi:thiamine pyrophosphate-dependent acetolactate synthase large subunit-like protein